MKELTGVVLAILCFACGCKKNVEAKTELSGTYIGAFQRISMAYQGPDSVKINFSDGRFDGETLHGNYPDICHGTYEIKGDSVQFNNECVFTADFDWTLILSGKFRVYYTGDSLQFGRKYTGTIIYSDTYTLKKQ